ncbi:MAG: hypothetical protein AAGE61_13200 [Pseudomonadota bacterium]
MENILLKKKGQGFEDIFSDIAKHAWSEKFEIWKPQGSLGDFKCDGYHVPEKTVFQCYGPEIPEPSKTAAKIRADFEGAKKHFGDRMAKWVFVYNQRDLPATCGKLLGELREKNPDIEVNCWCLDDLLGFAMNLSPERLSIVCGIGLRDHRFQDATLKALDEFVAENKSPSSQENGSASQTNQPTLKQALDDIAAQDREIRRRLLGYSMWLEPMSKQQAYNIVADLGLNVASIDPNAKRLAQMGLVRVTGSHILPVNLRVCNEAAETFADEFIGRLEVL